MTERNVTRPSTRASRLSRALLCGALQSVVTCGILAAAPESNAIAIGPGELESIGRIASSCPVFHWALAPGAVGDMPRRSGEVEIVVWRLTEDGDGATLEAVRRRRLPGVAQIWTPAVDACLRQGGRYAWWVRSLPEAGPVGEWSAPRFFEVVGGPEGLDVSPAQDGEVPATRPETASMPSTPTGRADRETPAAGRTDAELRGTIGEVVAGLQAPDADVLARLAAQRSTRSQPRLRAPGQASSALVLGSGVDLDLGGSVRRGTDLLLHTPATRSVGVGRNALEGAAAIANTAVGDLALSSNTTGGSNTAVGADAMQKNTSGIYNTAVGQAALYSNTGGIRNVALGEDALVFNQTGSYNTAVGENSMVDNLTGLWNTAVGQSALLNNTTSGNTAVGQAALFENTSGFAGVAVGREALRSNTTGNRNTAVGYRAMRSNLTGYDNTALGNEALYSSTEAHGNVAVGDGALGALSTGSYNLGVGLSAAASLESDAHYNVALGALALEANTGGNNNIAIGYGALKNSLTGANNIAIGGNAGLMFDGNESSNILIGNLGLEDDQQTLRIGTSILEAYIDGIFGSTVTSGVPVLVNGAGRLGTTTSSARFKERIEGLAKSPETADRLLSLRPVRFHYRPEVAGVDETPIEYGLIAEEVAALFPELVAVDDEGLPNAVRYHQLIPLLLDELQRQRRELEEVRRRLEEIGSAD